LEQPPRVTSSSIRTITRPSRLARAGAAAFGESALAADGGVDRAALAGRVTGDPEALARLNAAVHPLVHSEVEGWLAAFGNHDNAPEIAVVEAALMVETGSFRRYDLLAVVWCRPEQQLARAAARGMPEERTRALLAAQLPLKRKRELADLVFDNSGSLHELEAEVRRLWPGLRALCDAKAATRSDGSLGAG